MGKLINDLKCEAVQKAVYAKLYKGHKPNEWEPWNAPEVKTLENGMVCRSDVKYGETYPNSFADIWYPDESGLLWCTFTVAALSSATSPLATRCKPVAAVWENWKPS